MRIRCFLEKTRHNAARTIFFFGWWLLGYVLGGSALQSAEQ